MIIINQILIPCLINKSNTIRGLSPYTEAASPQKASRDMNFDEMSDLFDIFAFVFIK